ncbi:nucleotidyltransferase family protein [Sphingomonas sp.]|uniref:nucleotidyltransferase family protein n=1 Tax=Sphingomonas sp. TaxID=28214 RepID=UPI00286CF64D|nr:nucleotidyltransferase family protein [Sphingomonas sp.]
MTVRRSLRIRNEIAAEVPNTAMVMAAGLGKRMRPLTDTRPKPLVELNGKPLIDHVLDRLRTAGVSKLVVNVHYLPDQLEAHLATKADDFAITISDERSLLLETGGGLVQAAPMIDCDPFLVVNSDNFWIDGPADGLKLLASGWDDERMDALLLLVPQARAGNHRGQGDFRMDRFGRLSRRARSRIAPYVFTGIQIVSKRLLANAPDGAFSTNILWDRAIEAGRCFGLVHQGLWFDVGTPRSIKDTEAALINE